MKKPIPFDLAQKEVEALIDAAEMAANVAEGGSNVMGQRLPFEVPRVAMLRLRRTVKELRAKVGE
jgi:hypothetical protein